MKPNSMVDRYGRPVATGGTVQAWHDDQGWGVVESPETPGGCWVHFSAVAVAGDRSLTPGQPVRLEWLPARDQDGYRFVAVRVWPDGTEPVDLTPGEPGDAYRSTLTISFDRPPEARGAGPQ